MSNSEPLNENIIAYIESCKISEHPESYLVAVLHKVQEMYGWLSRKHIAEVAYKMRIPTARVFGVATFYNFFKLKPQGKYAISICLGTACFVKGADKILDEFKRNLEINVGETTLDGLFSIEETRCLGVCALAPAVKVNEQIYSNVEIMQVKQIIESIRTKEKV